MDCHGTLSEALICSSSVFLLSPPPPLQRPFQWLIFQWLTRCIEEGLHCRETFALCFFSFFFFLFLPPNLCKIFFFPYNFVYTCVSRSPFSFSFFPIWKEALQKCGAVAATSLLFFFSSLSFDFSPSSLPQCYHE